MNDMDTIIYRQDAIYAAISADMENNSGILSEKRARVIESHINIVPPAQPELQWIPCSERLPEKEGKYLVTDIKTVDTDIFTHSGNGTPMWFLSDNVTAWMPLPEPYNEGQDG